MPITSATTMAGIGRIPPRSRAAVTALMATAADSNTPGMEERMSATARVADVLGDVNGGSSRSGRWPGAS